MQRVSRLGALLWLWASLASAAPPGGAAGDRPPGGTEEALRRPAGAAVAASAEDDGGTFPGVHPPVEDLLKGLPTAATVAPPTLDEEVATYLRDRDAQIEPVLRASVLADWAYGADLTEANRREQMKVSAKLVKLRKRLWNEYVDQGWSQKIEDVQDPSLKRQLQKIEDGKETKLNATEIDRLNTLQGNMVSIYSTARVNTSQGLLELEPGLTKLFASSRDPDELLRAWVGFREATGRRYRDQYLEYVNLLNKDARLSNFSDLSEQRIQPYEDKDFKSKMAALYEEILPLYRQIHAHVRKRLHEKYGAAHVGASGPLPAHLLGNMWAQTWGGVAELTAPHRAVAPLSGDQGLRDQGFTPLKMFKLSNNFFEGLNLTGMPDAFWRNSIIKKPKDKDMVCHASAWDMYNGDDFRIKMCTEVNTEMLATIHHEMGHVQYYLQYKHQPLAFREGANPGFHEAVGDTLALSVMTPGHLRGLGLLTEDRAEDKKADLNFLMDMALKKVVFLPYAYMLDTYRWDVFSGATPPHRLNCHYWNKRRSIQGLAPPVPRTEEHFDAGAKYHVASDTPYIRYFFSHLLQFQLHEALCIAAGQFDPADTSSQLHQCDINLSKDAGNALKRMLSLGSSVPWPQALRQVTGASELSAKPLLRYFRPLKEWLDAQGLDESGWDPEGSTHDYCAQ